MYYIKALRQLFFNTLCYSAQLVIDNTFLFIPPSWKRKESLLDATNYCKDVSEVGFWTFKPLYSWAEMTS